ncbi:Replication factor A protein 1 [Orobanche minor]
MHCTSKGNVSHNFFDKLKDGVIYSIKDFTVIENKDEYRVLKDSAYMIEFDGATTVRKAAVKPDGFVRHPFQLVAFESLKPTDNKCLIGKMLLVISPTWVGPLTSHFPDVIGYINNVGRTTYQRTGSRNLDFHLANQSGHSIRVTLWGVLGEVLIEEKTKHIGLCAVILTSVNARHYNNKLYLSSSSSTLILDDDDIPSLKHFKADTSSSTFICKVRIHNVITRKGWNYPSSGGEKCKKGLTRHEGKFWCEVCNTVSDYPVIRYTLGLGVSDETEQTIVVMFDETATELVKHSATSLFGTEDEDSEDHAVLPRAIADIQGTTHNLEINTHTYYEHGNYESFTCSGICADQTADESAGSSTVDQTAKSTPLEPYEEKFKKWYDVEQLDTEIEKEKGGKMLLLKGVC